MLRMQKVTDSPKEEPFPLVQVKHATEVMHNINIPRQVRDTKLISWKLDWKSNQLGLIFQGQGQLLDMLWWIAYRFIMSTSI